VNSYDNINPVLKWNDSGSNSGPDNTCTVSNQPDTLVFFPGAFVLNSTGEYSVTVETNHVDWTNADLVRESPATSYSVSGEKLLMGQSTPGGGSAGYIVVDSGPQPLEAAYTASNTSGFGNPLAIPANMMFQILGNYLNDFHIGWRPADNGAIVDEEGQELYGTNPKPYSFFTDHAGNFDFKIDPLNNWWELLNHPVYAPYGVKASSWTFGNVQSSDNTAGYLTMQGSSSILSGSCTSQGNRTTNWSDDTAAIGFQTCDGTNWHQSFTINNTTGKADFTNGVTSAGQTLFSAAGGTLTGALAGPEISAGVYGGNIINSDTTPTVWTGATGLNGAGYIQVQATALNTGIVAAVNMGWYPSYQPAAGSTYTVLILSGTLPSLTIVQQENITTTSTVQNQIVPLPSPLTVTAGEYVGIWSSTNAPPSPGGSGPTYYYHAPSSLPSGAVTYSTAGAVVFLQPLYVSGTLYTGSVNAALSPSALAAATTIGGVSVCLSSGSNCPSGIAPAQITIGASVTFGPNACYSATGTLSTASTVAMAGLAGTNTLSFSPTSDVSGVTGWGPTAGLYFSAWPTSGTANYYVCNPTNTSITTGSSTTWNVSAR
jgi:hypothetical protein